MRHLQRWVWITALVLGIAACSKDKSIDEPAKLTPLAATLRVDRTWSASVDDKKAVALRLGLSLSADDSHVYAAGHRGDVAAFDLASGHTVWRTRTKAPLSGGTATGQGLVVVGTSDGRLFALDAANGAVRWSVHVSGEVLAPAVISERLIALRTVDGRLHALSVSDGHELWSYEQQVPKLSLRGTSRPVIAGDVLLCGFDNGKVAAVNMSDGSMQWEAIITPPHGRTELERLDDVDSPVSVSGHDVYTVGFQGRVAMLALDTGQIWWAHDASSYRGLTFDADVLYMVSADGEVVALRARTGAEIWRQKALLYRGLSAAAVTDDYVVTADFQGYVHWLDKATGDLAGRAVSGKVRVSNAPVVAGNKVLVINDRGQISAFSVRPVATANKRSAPATPPATPPAAQEPSK
jgi:outer membrane protein assembly factor BamB